MAAAAAWRRAHAGEWFPDSEHTCSSACSAEQLTAARPLYVCRSTGREHLCTDDACALQPILTEDQQWACPLTGRVRSAVIVAGGRAACDRSHPSWDWRQYASIARAIAFALIRSPVRWQFERERAVHRRNDAERAARRCWRDTRALVPDVVTAYARVQQPSRVLCHPAVAAPDLDALALRVLALWHGVMAAVGPSQRRRFIFTTFAIAALYIMRGGLVVPPVDVREPVLAPDAALDRWLPERHILPRLFGLSLNTITIVENEVQSVVMGAVTSGAARAAQFQDTDFDALKTDAFPPITEGQLAVGEWLFAAAAAESSPH